MSSSLLDAPFVAAAAADEAVLALELEPELVLELELELELVVEEEADDPSLELLLVLSASHWKSAAGRACTASSSGNSVKSIPCLRIALRGGVNEALSNVAFERRLLRLTHLLLAGFGRSAALWADSADTVRGTARTTIRPPGPRRRRSLKRTSTRPSLVSAAVRPLASGGLGVNKVHTGTTLSSASLRWRSASASCFSLASFSVKCGLARPSLQREVDQLRATLY